MKLLPTACLAFGLALVGAGRLGDLLGRRSLYMLGLVLFAVAGFAAALADDATTVIVARLVQGGFGAIMLPQGLGMIREMFPPEQRAQAFGAFGPVMGLSSMGGPILAGWLAA